MRVTGDNAGFMNLLADCITERERTTSKWCDWLRDNDKIRAVAPNDGWNCRRGRSEVVMVNPYFDRNHGDLIVIGNPDKFEIFKISGEETSWLTGTKSYTYIKN